VKVTKAEFSSAAPSIAAIPSSLHPEIAIAGRSNVGKSSLINKLVGRRALARTSGSPGCTRGLVFFNVNDEISLVDLPGYGYAVRAKTERAGWRSLVEHYLSSREELAGVLVLVDIRRGPEQEETMLARFLEHHGLPFAWVLTKSDKLAAGRLKKRLAELAPELGEAPALVTSARSGRGVDTVWAWVTAAIGTA
jgi:GTP-binding protein